MKRFLTAPSLAGFLYSVSIPGEEKKIHAEEAWNVMKRNWRSGCAVMTHHTGHVQPFPKSNTVGSPLRMTP